jgi:hypothetical protein
MAKKGWHSFLHVLRCVICVMSSNFAIPIRICIVGEKD